MLAGGTRLLAALGLAVLAAGPIEALDPRRPVEAYGRDVWQTDQGLPQNSVNAILQTRDGYLWIATWDGVVKFDGVRFVLVEPPAGADRRARRTVVLHEDPSGAVWAGTEGGGLIRWSRGEATRFTTREGLPDDRVIGVATGPEGDLWVSTASGLARLRDGVLRRVPLEDETPGSLGYLWLTRSGRLFVAVGGTLRELRSGRLQPSLVPEATDVTAFVEDSAGRLYVGAENGLFRWEAGTVTRFTEADGLAETRARSLLLDRDGSLWIGSRLGITRFSGGRFEALRSGQGFFGDDVPCLHEDREGSLWIGTGSTGLNRLKDAACRTYGIPEGLTRDIALTAYEDLAGHLWVGTNCGGLHLFEDGRFRQVLPGLLPNGCIWSLTGEPDGTLWIGTWSGGLYGVGDGPVKHLTPQDGLPSDVVLALVPARAGGVWAGTTRGLARVSGGRVAETWTGAGAASAEIHALLEEPDGTLWIGTYRGGLLKWKDGAVRAVYTTREGLPVNDVRALHRDVSGILWVGTFGGGLARLENGRFTRYGRHEGLLDDVISQILEDDDGNLWMSSNRGLFRVSRSSLNDFASGKSGSIQAFAYGTADGMRNRECNGGSQPAGCRRRDGTLWFPTIRGAVSIDPRLVRTNAQTPPVLIEDVIVDRQTLRPEGPHRIGPGRRVFEFHYAALSFTAPERVRFRYRMEGFDRDFIDADTRRVAYYTNLPPGSYTFRVQALGDGGRWNEEGASFRFTLEPSFLETRLFLATSALGLGLLVWGGYRLRVRQMRARERELVKLVAERTKKLSHEKERTERAQALAEEANRAKSQFLANMSHELRTPLNAIIGYAEMLQEEADVEPALRRVQGDLGKISSAGSHLLGLISDILDLSKIEAGKMDLEPSTFDVAALVQAAVTTLRPVVTANGNALDVTLEEPLGAMTADPTRVRQVLFNLLSNAGKFTRDGRVTLQVSRRPQPTGPDVIVFRVSDTGIGISPEQLARLFTPFTQADASTTRRFGGTGLGLAISRRLAELLGGGIDVASRPGEGTTFTVRLPAASPAPSAPPGIGT